MRKQDLDNKHEKNTEDHLIAQPAHPHIAITQKIKLYGRSKMTSDQLLRSVNMPEES